MTEPLPAGAPLAPGYEVIEHLKRTLKLDVYDVWSTEREARCIAKTLRGDHLDDEHARRRLTREGWLLETLTHPHIVRIYETLTDPQPMLILETIEGATLARVLCETPRGRLPASELGWLGLHMCSAIGYLHRQGWLHLDVKPSNVISDRGQAKLIDFSIARRPGPGRKGIGTEQYMAPEQRDGGWLTAATDVWGLGALLYEAAAGARERRAPSQPAPAARRGRGGDRRLSRPGTRGSSQGGRAGRGAGAARGHVGCAAWRPCGG